MDFAGSAVHRVKLKEIEKRDKSLDFAMELLYGFQYSYLILMIFKQIFFTYTYNYFRSEWA